ncbi:DUF6381 family protein [Streptomyces sp. NPDC048416]|uniref:DUF6381 family protein n=2 Tax=Streptomyces TaxID=1883 RepID=UPI00372331C1
MSVNSEQEMADRGVRLRERAEELEMAAQRTTDAEHRQRLREKARRLRERAEGSDRSAAVR